MYMVELDVSSAADLQVVKVTHLISKRIFISTVEQNSTPEHNCSVPREVAALYTCGLCTLPQSRKCLSSRQLHFSISCPYSYADLVHCSAIFGYALLLVSAISVVLYKGKHSIWGSLHSESPSHDSRVRLPWVTLRQVANIRHENTP